MKDFTIHKGKADKKGILPPFDNVYELLLLKKQGQLKEYQDKAYNKKLSQTDPGVERSAEQSVIVNEPIIT
jgi:hypothetical protein